MVVKGERLLGIDTFELLFAKRGKGGEEKKKPKTKRERRREEKLGWLERLKRQLPLPKKPPKEEPDRITNFVRAHKKPKRKKER